MARRPRSLADDGSGNRVYGRGTADNKGQHSINLAALRAVREARGGRLGFNAKFIVEMGEEIGSPDLGRSASRCAMSSRPICLWRPTGRGCRPTGRPFSWAAAAAYGFISTSICATAAHHSGNWGGVLANPAIILATRSPRWSTAMAGFSSTHLKPPRLSNQIRQLLADVKVVPIRDEPALADDWGEEGLSAAERLYAWNTLEVLAMSSGNIEKPANAIPDTRSAVLQLRFVVGTKVDGLSMPFARICCQRVFRWSR